VKNHLNQDAPFLRNAPPSEQKAHIMRYARWVDFISILRILHKYPLSMIRGIILSFAVLVSNKTIAKVSLLFDLYNYGRK
jgi:hypothetical protein